MRSDAHFPQWKQEAKVRMYYSVYVITFIIEFVAFKITQAEKMDASTSKSESLQNYCLLAC